MTLSDLATAWDVMECSGAANVGLVLDTWHFSRGAGTLAMVRSLPARAFRTVQISDGAFVGPPDLDYLEDTLSNRLPPGEGELDLTGIVQALVDIGADVAWDMEICSSVLDALPPSKAALPRHPGDPSGPGQRRVAVDRGVDVKPTVSLCVGPGDDIGGESGAGALGDPLTTATRHHRDEV